MSNIKPIIIKKTSAYTGSQGAVLIVSLILLLVMTLVGIAAIDSSTLQSQMTRNSFFAQSLYQVSRSEIEAQLDKVKNLNYLERIMTSELHEDGNPTLKLSDKQVETHKKNDPYIQTAALQFTGDGAPPTGYSLGLFLGKNFEINPVSKVQDTGSISDQTQGINYPAPM